MDIEALVAQITGLRLDKKVPSCHSTNLDMKKALYNDVAIILECYLCRLGHLETRELQVVARSYATSTDLYVELVYALINYESATSTTSKLLEVMPYVDAYIAYYEKLI